MESSVFRSLDWGLSCKSLPLMNRTDFQPTLSEAPLGHHFVESTFRVVWGALCEWNFQHSAMGIFIAAIVSLTFLWLFHAKVDQSSGSRIPNATICL